MSGDASVRAVLESTESEPPCRDSPSLDGSARPRSLTAAGSISSRRVVEDWHFLFPRIWVVVYGVEVAPSIVFWWQFKIIVFIVIFTPEHSESFD